MTQVAMIHQLDRTLVPGDKIQLRKKGISLSECVIRTQEGDPMYGYAVIIATDGSKELWAGLVRPDGGQQRANLEFGEYTGGRYVRTSIEVPEIDRPTDSDIELSGGNFSGNFFVVYSWMNYSGGLKPGGARCFAVTPEGVVTSHQITCKAGQPFTDDDNILLQMGTGSANAHIVESGGTKYMFGRVMYGGDFGYFDYAYVWLNLTTFEIEAAASQGSLSYSDRLVPSKSHCSSHKESSFAVCFRNTSNNTSYIRHVKYGGAYSEVQVALSAVYDGYYLDQIRHVEGSTYLGLLVNQSGMNPLFCTINGDSGFVYLVSPNSILGSAYGYPYGLQLSEGIATNGENEIGFVLSPVTSSVGSFSTTRYGACSVVVNTVTHAVSPNRFIVVRPSEWWGSAITYLQDAQRLIKMGNTSDFVGGAVYAIMGPLKGMPTFVWGFGHGSNRVGYTDFDVDFDEFGYHEAQTVEIATMKAAYPALLIPMRWSSDGSEEIDEEATPISVLLSEYSGGIFDGVLPVKNTTIDIVQSKFKLMEAEKGSLNGMKYKPISAIPIASLPSDCALTGSGEVVFFEVGKKRPDYDETVG